MTPIEEKTKTIDKSHRLEYGQSTWSKDRLSIRNRYDHENGRFDRVSSQEIPVSDLKDIILYATEVGALSREEALLCARALIELAL